MVAARPVKWCAVPLSEIVSNDIRLEASVYGVEARTAKERVISNANGFVCLMGEASSPVANAFYGTRGKRNYVSETVPNAIGFLGSSEMLDCSPVPDKFMPASAAEAFRIKQGMVLISRSGTIGNLAFANKTLSRFLVSEHAIRLECREYPGFVYAFLKSKEGQALVKACVFGSVILEIEPEHLAAKRRDNPGQNRPRYPPMPGKATDRVCFHTNDFAESRTIPAEVPQTFDIRLKDLAGRFDVSYHLPVVRAVEERLRDHAAEVATVGGPRVSKRIILPGRFKRVYVEEGFGKVFIGGKQLGELDPSNKKYLSVSHHGQRIDEQLTIRENMTLVTCSGTIGRVALVGRHWDGWTASQHILRVVPSSRNIAGYLYVWLSSEWAKPLVVRNAYGAVIDEISDTQLAAVPVPLLKDLATQAEINRLALEASALRSEAYDLEQEALRVMEDEVLSSGH